MAYQPLNLGLGTLVTSTVANPTNALIGETDNIKVGQLVVFQSPTIGGIEPNRIYYVKEIIDANSFTVSRSEDGAVEILSAAQGSMFVKSVIKDSVSESLKKVDNMLEEIYVINSEQEDITNVESDLSPKLGGNLDLNGNNIDGTGNISISGSINATTIAGGLRGVVAGGLIGPVDEEGVRTGNPTIDGLAFELGNPQAGQVIAWNAVNEKFVLVSVGAVSGTDTLDDVLFRGNTSTFSINVGGITTNTLSVTDGINYADIFNAPTNLSDFTNDSGFITGPISYNSLLDKPILFSGSYNDLTDKPTIPTNTNQLTNGAGFITTNGIPNQSGQGGKYLTTDGATLSWATVAGGGGGSGLVARSITSATTGALAINGVGNLSITGFKTYALLGMTVEIPAWVRLYTTAAARTADASRLETEDPLPGSGVIAEVITTSNNQTISFTPATIGFNGDTPASTTIYASVKNKGTGVATIQVTLTLVQLEA